MTEYTREQVDKARQVADLPAMAAALTAVLDALDRLKNENVQNSLTLGEIDPGTTTYSDGHLVGIHKGRIEATARIHEAITDALGGDRG